VFPKSLPRLTGFSPYGVRLRYGGADPETVDRQLAQRWASLAVDWATAQVQRMGKR